MTAEQVTYSVPDAVEKFLKAQGYELPSSPMMPFISDWYNWYRTSNGFYDYTDRSGNVSFKVHRLSTKPAVKVCEEWASLLLNEDTIISTESEKATEWLEEYLRGCNFQSLGQNMIQKGFALGTCAWALWFDLDKGKMLPRRYDAQQIIPLSWDDEGVTECAFCTAVQIEGKKYEQIQLHVLDGETYWIKTAYFRDGKQVVMEGINADFDTRCPFPTFAIFKPAIDNTFVDLSPYGQSVFANAIDIIQSVDLAYDAIFNGDVRCGKMRVFMSDMMFEQTTDSEGRIRVLPFGKDDVTFYRKVTSNSDELIHEYAPTLRIDSLRSAYGLAVQTLGDRCGFGTHYFKIDDAGGIRTATEVSSDNADLMRNMKKHGNALSDAIESLCNAIMFCGQEWLDAPAGDWGEVAVRMDDSIIQDTAAEKQQDLAEVGSTMNAWEYRMKWYGEDEETAKANVPGTMPAYEPEPLS